eukprot:g3859.t1
MTMQGLSSHNDILHAKPDNEESRERLVAELKSRGNASFKTKNMPVAERLYSKAIEHNDSMHTLFGNRSATRLALGKFELALEDADKAIDLCGSWSKGYLRRAQALAKLKRWNESKVAMELAVDVAGRASAKEASQMAKQQVKLFKEIEEGKEKQANELKKTVKKSPNKQLPPPPKPAVTRASSQPSTTTSSSAPAPKQGGEMRGYKLRADGTKTSFFDTQWDESTKQLYADQKGPKKITDTNQPSVVRKTGAAAWNSAGTYEETDATNWAKKKLRELLETRPISVETSCGTIEVSELKNLKGEATCPFTRGKRRHVFDFSFALAFKVACSGTLDGEGEAKGELVYPECTDESVADGEDFDCNLGTIEGSMKAQNALRRVILGGPGTLQHAVQARLMEFVDAFEQQ